MTTSKTPISILQELMVGKRLAIPEYIFVDGKIPNGCSFKCLVSAGGILAEGYGTTKKEAKQKSAEEALKLLGYPVVYQPSIPPIVEKLIVRKPSSVFINYVGRLNEFASIHRKPQPDYIDKIVPDVNGYFRMDCCFMSYSTSGYGSCKKDAKQDAAKNMLEYLQKVDSTVFNSTHIQKKTQERMPDLNLDGIIEKFKQIKSTNGPPTTSNINNLPPLISFDDEEEEEITMENFQEQMKKNNISYTIEIFQTNPYIMMLKLSNSDFTLMECGSTRNLALKKLLKKAYVMLKSSMYLNVNNNDHIFV